MMDNIMDYVSGNQLPSLMAGIQFHIDLANECGSSHDTAERYKYKKLLQSYKKGQFRQNLSHKLTMRDVQPANPRSDKKVKFDNSNLLRCYPSNTDHRPQLVGADDVTMSISANCSLKETQCRIKNK